MKNFGIFTNLDKDPQLETTQSIIEWLKERHLKVLIPSKFKGFIPDAHEELKDEELYQAMDCAIILGGDGTIIHSARQLAMHQVPILGINLGSLGFLAEVEKKDKFNVLDKIIQKEYKIEKRMMLSTELDGVDSQQSMGALALNDVVITRGGFSRIIELGVYVNDQMIDVYYADGIIISTPTGSTAYSLSAGGPILNPTTEMMVITPICPHSLTARSIVVSGDDVVRVQVENIRNKEDGDVVLSLDGQIDYKLQKGDGIVVRKSDFVTQLIKLKTTNFYTLLRKKIGSH